MHYISPKLYAGSNCTCFSNDDNNNSNNTKNYGYNNNNVIEVKSEFGKTFAHSI